MQQMILLHCSWAEAIDDFLSLRCDLRVCDLSRLKGGEAIVNSKQFVKDHRGMDKIINQCMHSQSMDQSIHQATNKQGFNNEIQATSIMQPEHYISPFQAPSLSSAI